MLLPLLLHHRIIPALSHHLFPTPPRLLPARAGRDVAPKVAVHWYNRRKGADSAVSLALCTGFRGVCTRQFTARATDTSQNAADAPCYTGARPEPAR